MTLPIWFCLLGSWVMRIKSGGRFDFSGSTVLLVSCGLLVSFNTTEGGSVCYRKHYGVLKDVRSADGQLVSCRLGFYSLNPNAING